MTTVRTDEPAIDDHGVIGNGRTAALVSCFGELDFLCLPRFDGDAFFCSLLDRTTGGRFTVAPACGARGVQSYRARTNVLETVFESADGVLAVTDCMPVASEDAKATELWPDHEVLRVVECRAGEVDVVVECEPRRDFGRRAVHAERRGELGVFFDAGAQAFALLSEIPLEVGAGGEGAHGSVRMCAGDRRVVSLAYADRSPLLLPALGEHALNRLERTTSWWQEWSALCEYEGPFSDAVNRSALALKLLTYAPSGAVVAAPTTSLPEEIGGVRNWDYRYCWLRDATATLGALQDLGYTDESEAFYSWLLYATALSRPEVSVVYDVYGRTDLDERELPWLHGYAGSSPVRVGNDASGQLQLDIYGELVCAIDRFERLGHPGDEQEQKLVAGLGDVVCRRWREPDNGIWEKRSGRQHHTYSKVMCWAALDRLLKMHDDGRLEVDISRFQRVRQEIRDEIEARGFNDELGSYTAVFDGDEVDASLLLLSHYGYASGRDERFRSTFTTIEEKLGDDGLLRRYREGTDDGLDGGEGAFGLCSFWAVECLVHMGRLAEAEERLERLWAYASELGLFGEEIDPTTGAALGNFPQAFTHLGVINAAVAIERARNEKEDRR